jgi:hypothetical protein
MIFSAICMLIFINYLIFNAKIMKYTIFITILSIFIMIFSIFFVINMTFYVIITAFFRENLLNLTLFYPNMINYFNYFSGTTRTHR